jgi:hypothetical protein
MGVEKARKKKRKKKRKVEEKNNQFRGGLYLIYLLDLVVRI